MIKKPSKRILQVSCCHGECGTESESEPWISSYPNFWTPAVPPISFTPMPVTGTFADTNTCPVFQQLTYTSPA